MNNPTSNRFAVRASASAALLALVMMLQGCNVFNWFAYAIGETEDEKVEVKAEYTGLNQKLVAVIVAADEYTLRDHPGANAIVCRAVSKQLAADIPGIRVIAPPEIIKYQQENPYWNTLKYSEIVAKFKVDRVVWVDLIDFTTHEPGNHDLWRGIVAAKVGVVERDSSKPDNFSYSNNVRAVFPKDSMVGVLNSDDATIQQGMMEAFAKNVSGLFCDHEETISRK